MNRYTVCPCYSSFMKVVAIRKKKKSTRVLDGGGGDNIKWLKKHWIMVTHHNSWAVSESLESVTLKSSVYTIIF